MAIVVGAMLPNRVRSTGLRYRVAKTHRMPNLQGIFRKTATNYRALLRKMTCEDKASYDSMPPCRSKVLAKLSHLDLCIFVF